MPTDSTLLSQGGHDTIADRSLLPFRNIDSLGAGASATVYIAEDQAAGQKFAHKAFHRYYGKELEKLKKEFKNEVEILKKLHSHPHIIQVFWSYSCGRDLGMLLTPVADGGDLRSYLQTIEDSGKPLTHEHLSTLYCAFGCLANGLEFIHSHTIRHKDIKPQNILVHGGRMIYTDFGIAFDASDQDTTTTGNPGAFTDRYRAPEVADSKPRNRKSDIFSLGCVFVEILAFLAPDADLGASDTQPYWKRIDAVRNALHRLRVSGNKLWCKSYLSNVCKFMLERENAHRYDAVELCQLFQYLSDISGPPYELFCGACKSSAPATDIDDKRAMGVAIKQRNPQSTRAIEAKVPSGDGLFTLYHVWYDRLKELKISSQVQELPYVSFGRGGNICILWQPRKPGVIHLEYNYTFRNIAETLWDSRIGCMSQFELHQKYTTETDPYIRHIDGVQTLVETELGFVADSRLCEGCGNHHRNRYRTSPEHAAKVIIKYSNWMKNEPYRYQLLRDLKWQLDTRFAKDAEELSKPIPII